jgi:hypothetical protein
MIKTAPTIPTQKSFSPPNAVAVTTAQIGSVLSKRLALVAEVRRIPY